MLLLLEEALSLGEGADIPQVLAAAIVCVEVVRTAAVSNMHGNGPTRVVSSNRELLCTGLADWLSGRIFDIGLHGYSTG